ncbi:MAG: TPM domain-containing protein, partial [Verrucomicrobiota bacterium]|nr:TPM domain-containing protein [Verrucomicrobiota bacterium]
MKKQILGIVLCTLALMGVHLTCAQEVMPPKPAFNVVDTAGVLSSEVVSNLNRALEQYERDTSNQFVVFVAPTMQSDSSVDDYTYRIAESWGVGQKDRKNGAVLFIFVKDRKMFIQVGYGLEAVIPDALAKRIIEGEIKPHFQRNDYNAGVVQGVKAMMSAAAGEYKGTGTTQAQGKTSKRAGLPFLIFVIIIIIMSRTFSGGGTGYSHGGRRGVWLGGGGGGWGGG